MLRLNRDDREALEWVKRQLGQPDLTDAEVLKVLGGTGEILAGVDGGLYNPDRRKVEQAEDFAQMRDAAEADAPLTLVGFIQNGSKLTGDERAMFNRLQENRRQGTSRRAAAPVVNRSEPPVSLFMNALLAQGWRDRRNAEAEKARANAPRRSRHDR